MANVKAKQLYREMNVDGMAEAAKAYTSAMERAVKCCPNCEHFKTGAELCALNNLSPPAKIIAFGCECFEEEKYIPF